MDILVDGKPVGGKNMDRAVLRSRSGGTYDVQLSFDFGTSEFGDVNLWTIIAGVFASAPDTGQDLETAFQGDTGHEQGSGAGLVWLRKPYDFSVTTGSDGMLHVAIGVWGTYEVQRTYLVDGLEIVFTPAGST